jgi:hypothetical protein
VIVPITDADGFFMMLGEGVKTLAETRKQSPLTIDLLVGSVKRYIARPEFRIRLDEVVTLEVKKLFDRLDDKELSPQASWSVDEFRRRLKVYEAATEPLAKAFGVLGRWGDDTELATVADTIRGVVASANKVGSGLTVWLGLRTYPAVLLMTAYGLGLTRAERWKTLHDLFSLSMPREERDPKSVVNSLFLWDWKGWDDNLWNNVEGFTTGSNRRKTPLSDHLLDIFSEWGDAFLGVPTDNALLFDRFEALGAVSPS